MNLLHGWIFSGVTGGSWISNITINLDPITKCPTIPDPTTTDSTTTNSTTTHPTTKVPMTPDPTIADSTQRFQRQWVHDDEFTKMSLLKWVHENEFTINNKSGEYFSGLNIFQGWISFRVEYFSGVNFLGWIFLKGEYF